MQIDNKICDLNLCSYPLVRGAYMGIFASGPSKTDTFERLWISVRYGKDVMAIGTVYFPVDNLTSSHEDAEQLQNELLQNIGELETKFTNVFLIGDFNGKASDFRQASKHSSNGVLLDNLINATDMTLLNSTDKCTVSTTWSRGTPSSTIDYVLCNSNMYDNIVKMVVDEDHKYSIGSDHNFIGINVMFPPVEKSNEPDMPKVQKWNITDSPDWSKFEAAARDNFHDWNKDSFSNIDDMRMAQFQVPC